MITIRDIQTVVADRYGITVDQILSGQRSRRIARPRQIAMYLTRECRSDASLPLIGREFQRDHSTVMHSIAMVEHRIAGDRSLLRDLEALRAVLRQRATQPGGNPEHESTTREPAAVFLSIGA